MNQIMKMYQQLYDAYGPQGWWPILAYDGVNDSKEGACEGYHVRDYSFPRNRAECFEVCLGSILTQNTTFTSVVKSLRNLEALNALTPEGIQNLDDEQLKQAIRPSGYHNQKARYIRSFTDFFIGLNGRVPERDMLLALLGIGPETADSILLYAYNQPQLKIDAYTKRILMALGLVDENVKYHQMKELMENAVKEVVSDSAQLTITYQELHALIVNHAKLFYSKKPYGIGCFLKP